MKQVLIDIIKRLKEVPGLKTIQVFNNQYTTANEKREDVICYPAAFVELVNITYNSFPQRTQYADMTIRIHVVNESLTQGQDFTIYDLKDEVTRYLYGFTTKQLAPLQRSFEETDVNHDNLFIYKIEYTTKFTEIIDKVLPKTVVISSIAVAYDLDIDNSVIRTGDNQGYTFGTPDLIQ